MSLVDTDKRHYLRFLLVALLAWLMKFLNSNLAQAQASKVVAPKVLATRFNCYIGKEQSHITFKKTAWGMNLGLSIATHNAFNHLMLAAAEEGIKLRIISAYRSFERQQNIWDLKANGARTVYDDNGQPLLLNTLDPWQQVQAILRWTALPGGSRHHWGTDIDVYDGAAIQSGYVLQLTAEESYSVFSDLHNWLDKRIMANDAFGFYRPYTKNVSGSIGVEPWHLSYAPEAHLIAKAFNRQGLHDFIATTDIALKKTILSHFDIIYLNYIGAYLL